MVGWFCCVVVVDNNKGSPCHPPCLKFACLSVGGWSVSLISQFASLSCKQRPRPFYILCFFPSFLLLFSFPHLYSFHIQEPLAFDTRIPIDASNHRTSGAFSEGWTNNAPKQCILTLRPRQPKIRPAAFLNLNDNKQQIQPVHTHTGAAMASLKKLQWYFYVFLFIYTFTGVSALVLGNVWLRQSADGAPRDAVISRPIEQGNSSPRQKLPS